MCLVPKYHPNLQKTTYYWLNIFHYYRSYSIQDGQHSQQVLKKHKNGHNSVNFTNTDLKFGVAVAETDPQHTF